jgi:haloalkane dehalogenase
VRIDAYAKWLPQSEMPKFMLFGEPGGIIPRAAAENMATSWSSLATKFVGPGLHFVQEDQGPEIGKAIVEWASTIGVFNSDNKGG